jgi:hypothetical protein
MSSLSWPQRSFSLPDYDGPAAAVRRKRTKENVMNRKTVMTMGVTLLVGLALGVTALGGAVASPKSDAPVATARAIPAVAAVPAENTGVATPTTAKTSDGLVATVGSDGRATTIVKNADGEISSDGIPSEPATLGSVK